MEKCAKKTFFRILFEAFTCFLCCRHVPNGGEQTVPRHPRCQAMGLPPSVSTFAVDNWHVPQPQQRLDFYPQRVFTVRDALLNRLLPGQWLANAHYSAATRELLSAGCVHHSTPASSA
eukprot:5293438-Amphidinium_carterae.1